MPPHPVVLRLVQPDAEPAAELDIDELHPVIRHFEENDHKLTLERWHALLVKLCREEYRTRRLPAPALLTHFHKPIYVADDDITYRPRLDVYAEREDAGLQITNAADEWFEHRADGAIYVHHLDNGEDVIGRPLRLRAGGKKRFAA